MTLSRCSLREAPDVEASPVARAASGKEITAPIKAPRNDIWKVSRIPLPVVWSVLAERSGGNISEINFSMGPVPPTSSTRSKPTPCALQPVRPRMTRTTRAGPQEKRGTAPPMRGRSVGEDAIPSLHQRYGVFSTFIGLLGTLGIPVLVVAFVYFI